MQNHDSGDAPLQPDDPELGFGDDMELEAEPLESPARDVEISPDADAPLDVEPDPDLDPSVDFSEDAPGLDAEDDADRAARELHALRAELDTVKRERDRLRAENARNTERIEAAPKGEIDELREALAKAQSELEELRPLKDEIGRVEGLEDRIGDLQEELVAKEREAAALQEKLDSEAARSYRLSQRRIPSLNAEIEKQQQSQRELERKLQKAELTAATYEEQVRDLEHKAADLERVLKGAKARAQDTAVIQPGDTDGDALVDDELRRLSNRLSELETERAELTEQLMGLGKRHREELRKHESRADRLERESDDRYEEVLKQRTELRVLKERISGILKLAQDLESEIKDERRPLLDAMRKLATPPSSTRPGEGQSSSSHSGPVAL